MGLVAMFFVLSILWFIVALIKQSDLIMLGAIFNVLMSILLSILIKGAKEK